MGITLPRLQVSEYIDILLPPAGMKPYRTAIYGDEPLEPITPITPIDPKNYYITSGDAIAKARQLYKDQIEYRQALVKHILSQPPQEQDQKSLATVDYVIQQTDNWIEQLVFLKGTAFCVEFSCGDFRLTTPRSQRPRRGTRREEQARRRLLGRHGPLGAV
jgi:hypothetical protein